MDPASSHQKAQVGLDANVQQQKWVSETERKVLLYLLNVSTKCFLQVIHIPF